MGATILLLDKIDFKAKAITKDKEGHKGEGGVKIVQQEDTEFMFPHN